MNKHTAPPDLVEQLTKALLVARQWMPQHPLPNTGAVEDCELVDAAIARAIDVTAGGYI